MDYDENELQSTTKAAAKSASIVNTNTIETKSLLSSKMDAPPKPSPKTIQPASSSSSIPSNALKSNSTTTATAAALTALLSFSTEHLQLMLKNSETKRLDIIAKISDALFDEDVDEGRDDLVLGFQAEM